MATATANPRYVEGEINPQTMYRLERAKQITGLGDFAFRTARAHGLEVIYTGGKAFVMGSTLIDYLRTQAPRNKPANMK